jgi:leucyl aminopeptidase
MQTTLKKSADPRTARADLLLVTVQEHAEELAGPARAVDDALGGALARAVADREITGKAGQVVLFHAGDGLAAPRVAVVGVGSGDQDGWRSGGEAAGRRASGLRARSVALALPARMKAESARAFVEGVELGAYRFDRFRTRAPEEGEPQPGRVERLSVVGGGVAAADLGRAARIAEAVNAARDLVNTPANHLTPSDLAARAEALAAGVPELSCKVLDERALRRMGAGALLGVARGSDEPPRMIVLRYRPKRVRTREVLGLVGKAVTFDSGGISIKPSSGMEEMKMDMGGGAAVIEGTGLVAALGLPVEVLTVVPSTENLPSGHAIKPGDVLTAMNGRTIEVINTDAEGRLILADGLTHAARQGATRMVDMATLTGAIVVALGEVYAGLFGSDRAWTDEVRAAADAVGELVWPMPMHERYKSLVASKVADLANSSNKRQAGAVYAAQFLQEFTEGVPWCHIDVAGTAMVGGRGTGFGVRLIASLAERMAGKR